MSIPTNRNDVNYKSELIKHINHNLIHNLIRNEVNDTGLHLILACINNDIDLINRLLLEGADIKFTTAKDDFSLLEAAILFNHLEVVELLIKHSPLLHKVSLRNNLPIEVVGYINSSTRHISPLEYAFKCKHDGILKFLIKSGAKLSSKYDDTEFNAAVRTGSIEIVKMVIDQGHDINGKNRVNITPLKSVASLWNEDEVNAMVDFLIQNNADIEGPYTQSSTALCTAILSENNFMVAALIRHNVKITCDSSQSNIIPRAIQIGNMTTLKLLFDASANFTHDKDKPSLTEAIKESTIEVCEFLIERGLNVNEIHEQSMPILEAIKLGSRTKLKLLLKNGVDPNLKITENTIFKPDSALIHASRKGEPHLLLTLLDHGAEIDYCGKEGTALMQALFHRKGKATLMLIKKGANLNIPNLEGQTPLMMAINNSKPEIALTLIEKGANLSLLDNRGRSAFDLAKLTKQVSIVSAIENVLLNNLSNDVSGVIDTPGVSISSKKMRL